MRLRDVLPHANFVASSSVLDDDKLILAAKRARVAQEDIQHFSHHPNDGDDADDWRYHILALMLLRDCLGREMVRRGLTPPGPPMLARDWESGGMYPVSSATVPMPDWLLEHGRKELASGAVAAYATGKE